MAATVAVETVIDEHYGEQSDALADGSDPELKAMIDDFRADEVDHKETAERAQRRERLSGDAGGDSRRLPHGDRAGKADLTARRHERMR